MLPKKSKPKYIEHKRIAVTCLSSKIICGFFREKIEIHLAHWIYTYETQYGFTKGAKWNTVRTPCYMSEIGPMKANTRNTKFYTML